MSGELKISLSLDQLEHIIQVLRFQTEAIINVGNELRTIRKLLRLRRPGQVGLRVTREEGNMLRFVLVLPPPGAADVVNRRLAVSVDGGAVEEEQLQGTTTESGEYVGADGATVIGGLVDIDDAGNESLAREFSFVLSDTIAPPIPGEIGIRITGEE